jgi:four helix bundle protein
MAKINSFEEIPVWQQSIELATMVYKACEKGKLKTDFDMKSQIRKAACSVSNNIAEGYEYDNRKDFIRFLRIAKGSCGEVRNQLIIIKSVQLIDELDFIAVKEKCISISKQLKGFIEYLKNYPDQKNM